MTIILLIIKRLFFGGVFIVLGYLALKFTAKLMMWFGFSNWAENVPGGTGFVWKIVGISLIIAGIIALLGGFKSFGL